MSIYEALVEKALALARGKTVKKALFGLHFVFSELEGIGSGLAYLDRELLGACCESTYEPIWGQPADLLIKQYLHGLSLRTPLALSLMNALFNSQREILKEAISNDPFNFIKIQPEDEVLMIGYFESIFKRLEGKVKRIWVVEKEEGKKSMTFPVNKAGIRVAIITSATLANKSFHEVIPFLEGISEVLLMGPSTPFCPEVFRNTPVTWLCGSVVRDSELLFRLICEGKGGPILFKLGALERINLRIRES